MQFTEVISLKLSTDQKERLDREVKKRNMKQSDLLRDAIENFLKPGALPIPMTDDDWKLLQTVADHNKTDVVHAAKLIWIGYHALVNTPLGKVIKPLGQILKELRENETHGQ